jgi:hypothetical protein
VHETDLPVDDPAAAHVVVRTSDGAALPELTRHRRGMLTSLSVVVLSADAAGLDLVRAMTELAPPQYRMEFVVADGAHDGRAGEGLDAIARHLDQLAWSWEIVEEPAGGRIAAFDQASAVATGEFVVVAAPGVASVQPLTGALGHMWVNGADALIVGGAASRPDGDGSVTAVPSAASTLDVRAERLITALGLRRGPAGGSPAIVVLRRWVARFLFDDIARAIDPVEEFAERVRLVEMRLVEVVDSTP